MVPWPAMTSLVVVGVDEGLAGLLLDFDRFRVGVVVDPLDQHDVRPVALGRLNLLDRRAGGDADGRLDVVFPGGEGDALGVVAGRAGDDAGRFLGVRELGNLIVGAADLEGAGHLQILRLEIQVAAGHQLGSLHQLGPVEDLFQDKRSLIDFV